MDTYRTAQFIASMMLANCEAHLNGRRSREDWDREQRRLWTLAKRRKVEASVLTLVYPKALPPPPPYAVRKAMREATLRVGRMAKEAR